jgi:hypothetical protein
LFSNDNFGIKGKKKKPTHIFVTVFATSSFSTFAAYKFLCVEESTHKNLLATPPAAKELNPYPH